MTPSKLSQTLFSGVLALVASGSTMGRPLVFEPHDDDTSVMRLGKAALSPAVGQAPFAVSGALLRPQGTPRLGASYDASRIGGVISRDSNTSMSGAVHHGFDIGDFSSHAWHPNSRASLTHKAHGHGPAGVADTANALNAGFARIQEHGGSTVAEVPEPSTYALLGLGLAGIAFWQRRSPTGSGGACAQFRRNSPPPWRRAMQG